MGNGWDFNATLDELRRQYPWLTPPTFPTQSQTQVPAIRPSSLPPAGMPTPQNIPGVTSPNPSFMQRLGNLLNNPDFTNNLTMAITGALGGRKGLQSERERIQLQEYLRQAREQTGIRRQQTQQQGRALDIEEKGIAEASVRQARSDMAGLARLGIPLEIAAQISGYEIPEQSRQGIERWYQKQQSEAEANQRYMDIETGEIVPGPDPSNLNIIPVSLEKIPEIKKKSKEGQGLSYWIGNVGGNMQVREASEMEPRLAYSLGYQGPFPQQMVSTVLNAIKPQQQTEREKASVLFTRTPGGNAEFGRQDTISGAIYDQTGKLVSNAIPYEKPSGGGGGGTKASSIAMKYEADPYVKKYVNLTEGMAHLNTVDPKAKIPAQHQAMVYMFAKALDPESVVREGEYATIKRYAQSMLSKWGKEISQAIAGTGFLSEGAIRDMKTVLQGRYQQSAQVFRAKRKFYGDLYDKAGGDPEDLIDYEKIGMGSIQEGVSNKVLNVERVP